MKERSSGSSNPASLRTKYRSFAKRLARLRKRLIKAFSEEESGGTQPVHDRAFWSSVLSGELVATCPAEDFRRASFKFRKAGELAEAEKTATLGLAHHPSDLRLALELAEITKLSGTPEARVACWQRVIDLGGAEAPATAFKHLADCHRIRGAFNLAESVVRRGLAIHPDEAALKERLVVILCAGGRVADALELWKRTIEQHPDKCHAASYFRISQSLRDEGLLERADQTVREGLGLYPEDARLQAALAELDSSKLQPGPPDGQQDTTSFSTHLFQDRRTPFGRGVLCFSSGTNALRQHVAAMLDLAETVPPPSEKSPPVAIDVFAVWGGPSRQQDPIRELAAKAGKPLLCLDSGFISSSGIEGKDTPAQSVVVCPDHVYFDTTKASQLECTLNSSDHQLSGEQQIRTEACITAIVSHRLSKFNHAPRVDLRRRFPQDGTQRILLVDQRIGGGSVHWSLGGPGTFERMWDAALAMPDHEVLVKLHPEVISGRCESHLLRSLPDPLPGNVKLIDFDVNPYDLFDVVDQVFVCTSQLGFEAAMAGKTVHCFGAPFYSGWGFTHDRLAVPRRKRQRSVAEIFHLYYIAHSRYFVPGLENAEIEDLIQFLAASEPESETPTEPDEEIATPPSASEESLRILIVIPSGRYGATGRYLQNLAVSMIQLGCEVMILAEGPCPKVEAGVRWISMEFDGLRLSEPIRRAITDFAPTIIYENGVRSRAQRAALEAMVLTNARFAMQSEDDDIQIHSHREGETAAKHLIELDRPEITIAQIAGFLRGNGWERSLQILLDPEYNRWIDPILRILCYRIASLHTAIWHPFAERLSREYGTPTLIVPPVASAADFHRMPLTPEERERALNRHGVDPSRVVIFIGGALYAYSSEYATFLDALSHAARQSNGNFALVVTSDRSSLPLGRIARERLDRQVSFTDIGVTSDDLYMEMLKACDVVCSPGMPDSFNRFRLPSRLVKAMAMAKPILTCRCGFGESLQHNENAFLMDGVSPTTWADSIALCAESANRERVGKQGQLFAREHFDSDRVAAALKKSFESILAEPPRTLAAGVTTAPHEDAPRADPSIRTYPSLRYRNRFHSTLQFAIRALASRTHRLDTVIHIGAGNCGELDDYCRLGARRIHLVEGSHGLAEQLRHAENLEGTLTVRQAIVTAAGGIQPVYFHTGSAEDPVGKEVLSISRPLPPYDRVPAMEITREEQLPTVTLVDILKGLPTEPGDELLALECEGMEAELLASTPPEHLIRFRWIISRVPETPIHERAAAVPSIEVTLAAAGFIPIPTLPNHTDLMPSLLFERRTSGNSTSFHGAGALSESSTP